MIIDSSAEALQERPNQIIPRENGGKCVENVYLEKVAIGKSNKDNDRIFFTFQEKNEKGQVVGEQEIGFNDPTALKVEGNVTEEIKAKIIQDTVARIKHIFSGFILDEAIFKERIEGFIPWCNHKITALNGKNIGVKCRLKLVYNGKYIDIPKYPISFLSTEKREIPVFTINPQYDKFTPPSSEGAIGNAPASSSAAEGSF